jgi:hypothetical protein
MPTPNGVPTLDDLQTYSVNTNGWDVVRQKLYDSAVYAAAGQAGLTFFQVPIGGGAAVLGAGAKTRSDTNMTLAGQLPTNQQFLIESIEIDFFAATPTVAAGMPAVFGAQLAATSINDNYIFRRAGNLVLTIGSKDYLTEAPLMKFPPKTVFSVDAALSDVTTPGASLQSRISSATVTGRPYMLRPVPLVLTSNQNFALTLNWPEGVQAIANPAKVVVSLDGFLFRKAQ